MGLYRKIKNAEMARQYAEGLETKNEPDLRLPDVRLSEGIEVQLAILQSDLEKVDTELMRLNALRTSIMRSIDALNSAGNLLRDKEIDEALNNELEITIDELEKPAPRRATKR